MTEPKREGSRRAVAVFGGGIAGLTVAHELCRRGWKVTIYESNTEVGGFFRSARVDGDANMPSEYSWHGIGPWYHNVLDVMRQTPFDDSGSVYDKALSRPISFGMVPDEGPAMFDVRNRFRMTRLDLLRWGYLMLKTWTANRRSSESYSSINAAEAYRPLLSDTAWRTWRASFGPWVGSDWMTVSLHQVGLFFRKQFFSGPKHHHPADDEGPAWVHGARSGWLVLRGPSSEAWFDPWVRELKARGVEIQYGAELIDLTLCDGRITAAKLASGESVQAELYVLATNPFAAKEVLDRSPGLAELEELRCFAPLIQDGPHTQVSFRIAFAQRIEWPRKRSAVVIADSEYNLTLCPQDQVWRTGEDLGEGVASLWTGTACVAKTPGRVHGLTLERCTKEQFIDEVLAQLSSCEGLDALIREANNGRSWQSFEILKIEVWHEWMFSPDGIRPNQPKWVNTTQTQRFLPSQRTPVPNLALAGAHTQTSADVWSIEAAVESGRRAARLVELDVTVVDEYVPPVLRVARSIDDLCYAVGLPHALDLFLVSFLMLVGLALLA